VHCHKNNIAIYLGFAWNLYTTPTSSALDICFDLKKEGITHARFVKTISDNDNAVRGTGILVPIADTHTNQKQEESEDSPLRHKCKQKRGYFCQMRPIHLNLIHWKLSSIQAKQVVVPCSLPSGKMDVIHGYPSHAILITRRPRRTSCFWNLHCCQT
jgi:hypothetical protein